MNFAPPDHNAHQAMKPPCPLPSSLTFRRDHRFLRLLLSALSTLWFRGTDRRLAILFFHRVRPSRDPLFPGELDREQFAAVMEVVAECFRCLPLEEALRRLSAGASLPPRAVAISFDDGYADNFTEALPILQHYGLTATFFVASGFLDGGCMWNDETVETLRAYGGDHIDLTPLGLGIRACRTLDERIATILAVKDSLKYRTLSARREGLDLLRSITGAARLPDLMLTSSQVRQMQGAGMGIGGHTLSHPILACLEDAEARREICTDREKLTSILGAAPMLFAYPNGKPGQDYDSRHVAMVRGAGYRAAFTTVRGVASRGIDPFQIPRFTPWDHKPLRFAVRLAHSYTCKRVSLA